LTVALDGVAERVKGAVEVPVRATVCGEPVLLSVIERIAAAVPVRVGAKVTDAVQVELLFRVDPHVFVARNSAAFGPVTAMPEMLAGASPELLMVTV
jgi:hypothetical protein